MNNCTPLLGTVEVTGVMMGASAPGGRTLDSASVTVVFAKPEAKFGVSGFSSKSSAMTLIVNGTPGATLVGGAGDRSSRDAAPGFTVIGPSVVPVGTVALDRVSV